MQHPTSGTPLLSAAHLARLQHLDAHWAYGGRARPDGGNPPLKPDIQAPAPTQAWDFDVALVGGGLSLLLAALMARRGHRVVVIDRAQNPAPHREWNASAQELRALVDIGVCSEAELDALIVARYDHGICRWHGGGTQIIAGVLDCAVDATDLWLLAARRAAEAGVTFLRGVAVNGEQASDAGVMLALSALAPDTVCPATLYVGAMVDGRGGASPYATGDLVCPTVGGVLTGLDVGPGPQQINPNVGEILVTTEDVEEGRQHLWEAFPGKPGETAVYLFYYAQPEQLGPAPLQALYHRFIRTLPRYKSGTWSLVRPTFGVIPGYSRLGPVPSSPHRRIVLVGDAAGRQSPLTFCGFGAMLRDLPRAVEAVAQVLKDKGHAHLAEDVPIHGATGALALMLAHADKHRPECTNALLQAAFASLHAAGHTTFAALLQDRMTRAQAVQFLWQVSKRYPGVWQSVLRQLGPLRATRWAWQMRKALPAVWQAQETIQTVR